MLALSSESFALAGGLPARPEPVGTDTVTMLLLRMTHQHHRRNNTLKCFLLLLLLHLTSHSFVCGFHFNSENESLFVRKAGMVATWLKVSSIESLFLLCFCYCLLLA